jgi:hypothetical protein
MFIGFGLFTVEPSSVILESPTVVEDVNLTI